MNYLPVALKVWEKKIVLIGGGKVALHKIGTLLDFREQITIVAPDIHPEIEQAGVAICKRKYQPSDVEGAFLVYACTNDEQLNQSICADARRRGAWVNVVDNSSFSDFISPAVFRNEEAIVAVYTDGKNPKLSRDLKNFLKDRWNEFLSYRDQL